jgi:hypothetical protein
LTDASDVRTAWLSLWADGSITAVTDKVLQYEATDVSETEIALITSDARINFVEQVTTRIPGARELGSLQVECQYLVEIRYSLEKNAPGEAFDGTAHAAVIDFLDLITSKVDSVLGLTWGGSVEGYEFAGAPTITSAQIGGRDCWRGVIRFSGFGFTTL